MPIAARVRERVLILKRVRHVSWLNIVIENVKLLIVHNIKESVEDELPRYTMKSCLNNLNQGKTVQYVLYVYRHLKWGVNILHAVEKGYAVDAFMLLDMMT